jgi:alkanesulfonate monooxygenase SsuD/methylene tetrahydromethanopterin reductase-like flavin-dependent oxidoreductase (luciferase family)
MKRIWSGETAEDGAGPVGPPPSQAGGPEILIGGSSQVSIRRVGRWGDGLILPGTPDSVREAYEIAKESWKAEGREGTPRLVGAAYYALGPDAGDRGSEYIHDYYSFMGPAADYVAGSVISTPDAVRAAIRDFSGIGMDELIFWPTVPDLDQVDRLAELVP